jgi:hypothetical protein
MRARSSKILVTSPWVSSAAKSSFSVRVSPSDSLTPPLHRQQALVLDRDFVGAVRQRQEVKPPFVIGQDRLAAADQRIGPHRDLGARHRHAGPRFEDRALQARILFADGLRRLFHHCWNGQERGQDQQSLCKQTPRPHLVSPSLGYWQTGSAARSARRSHRPSPSGRADSSPARRSSWPLDTPDCSHPAAAPSPDRSAAALHRWASSPGRPARPPFPARQSEGASWSPSARLP